MENPSISISETKARGKSLFAMRDFKKNEVVFTICGPVVKKQTIYTIPIASDLFVDDEGMGKYLCHSCDPNCGIRNRTQVSAMRDIVKGEEITIDYAMIVYDYKDEMTSENRICKCGSLICRGKLGSYKELPDGLRQKYEGYISEFLLN
jgi:hypothetical protein